MVTHTNCSIHVLIARIVILKALIAKIMIFIDKYVQWLFAYSYTKNSNLIGGVHKIIVECTKIIT